MRRDELHGDHAQLQYTWSLVREVLGYIVAVMSGEGALVIKAYEDFLKMFRVYLSVMSD